MLGRIAADLAGLPVGPGISEILEKNTVAGALHFIVGRFFGLLGFGCLGFSDGVPAWPVSFEITNFEISCLAVPVAILAIL